MRTGRRVTAQPPLSHELPERPKAAAPSGASPMQRRHALDDGIHYPVGKAAKLRHLCLKWPKQAAKDLRVRPGSAPR
jgi:hypothetical protein